MAWLIRRTAPQEQTAYWGKREVWVLRPPAAKPAEALKPRIPQGAAVFYDWDIAHQVAEWLRTNQPLAYGEVISLADAPEGT